VWLPSGISLTPLTNYAVFFRNDTLREEAIKICHKLFYIGDVQKLCSSALVSQARFYYEACISDIADSGSLAHHKLSISLFGLYCQKILNIKECKLYGTFDAFPPCRKSKKREEFPIIAIITITIIVVLLLFVLCLVFLIFVIKRRRRRRNQLERNYIREPDVSVRNFTLPEQGIEMDDIYRNREDQDEKTETETETESESEVGAGNLPFRNSRSFEIEDKGTFGQKSTSGNRKGRDERSRKKSSNSQYHTAAKKDPSVKTLMYGSGYDSDGEDEGKGKGPADGSQGDHDKDSDAQDGVRGRTNRTFRDSKIGFDGGKTSFLPSEDYETDSDKEVKMIDKGRLVYPRTEDPVAETKV
jgi:hypothetical protein